MNSFGWAIKQMQNGLSVMREAWKGQGDYLKLQVPDANSKMKTPYIYLSKCGEPGGSYTPSQADMLAVDWIEAIWPATRVHEPRTSRAQFFTDAQIKEVADYLSYLMTIREPQQCTHPLLYQTNGFCWICNERVEWQNQYHRIPCTHPMESRFITALQPTHRVRETYCMKCLHWVNP